MTDLSRLAGIVDRAALMGESIAQFSDTSCLSEEEGYAVQGLSMQRRYARGDRRIGVKMGFTSRAKQVQMGIDGMIWGRLTESMREEEGGRVIFGKYVHPRVEPEIAYLIRDRLAGDVTLLGAMNAVAGVAPAMEIIDSRYENFKFDLGDVLADNSSASGFVVGDWFSPDTDVRNLGLVLSINGRVCAVGSSAAILGNPSRALVAASRMVAIAGETLEPGDIVLAGGATAAAGLSSGDHVATRFQSLGTVAFTIEE